MSEQPDYLSMSDEDFLRAPIPKAPVEQEEPELTEEELEAKRLADEAAAAEGGEQETEEEQDGGEEEQEEEETPAKPDKGDDGDDVDEDEPVTQPKKKPEAKKSAAATADSTGLPEGAERIFQEFKASGRMMKVRSVDEAIRLMQMGANYSEKQAEVKPKLAFVKTLEKHGLLDHDKLAYLIDLHNKNPEAIGKLVKDAGIDIHELDEAKVAGYKAKGVVPQESELALDEVLSDLKRGTNYDRILKDVEGWDDRSKAAVGNNPGLLSLINEQMENGVYDKIMDEVRHQRVLGNLTGMPLLQAYDEVGKRMNAEGAFAPQEKVPVKKLVTAGKKPPSAKPEDEQRRRAAAPSSTASAVATEEKKKNFLDMSDEDFLKLKRK